MRRWACIALSWLMFVNMDEFVPRAWAQSDKSPAKTKTKPRSKTSKKPKKTVEK